MDQENVVYVHNGIILFRLKKEGNPAICGNIYEPGGHYAEWDKPDTKRQILSHLTSVGI